MALMVFGIMVLNPGLMLVTLLISRKIFQLIAISPQILATMLVIIQAALELKIIYKSLKVLLHE